LAEISESFKFKSIIPLVWITDQWSYQISRVGYERPHDRGFN